MGHDEAEEEVPERPGGCDGGRPVLQRSGCYSDHCVPDLLPPLQLRILVLLLHPLQLKTTLQHCHYETYVWHILFTYEKSHFYKYKQNIENIFSFLNRVKVKDRRFREI